MSPQRTLRLLVGIVKVWSLVALIELGRLYGRLERRVRPCR